MKFFYENNMGDSGYFYEKDMIKAIYTAWNIEATLYLLNDGVKKLDPKKRLGEQLKVVFSPYDGNEFNSDVLKEFGYRMEDGKEKRNIIAIETGKIVKYEWSEVKQLV